MPALVDYGLDIGVREPQAISLQLPSDTPSVFSAVVTNTSPFSPETTTHATPSTIDNGNNKSLRTIIEYFFLIMALLLASILVFRRIMHVRNRRRETFTQFPDAYTQQGQRNFSRTTSFPRFGYPSYFVAVPLPTARNDSRRTHANDVDSEGRRFASPGTEVDHDGFIRDKDHLPKYESFGAPPKYGDLQQPYHVLPAITVNGIVDNDTALVSPTSPLPSPPPPAVAPQHVRNSGSIEMPPRQSRDENSLVSPSATVFNLDSAHSPNR